MKKETIKKKASTRKQILEVVNRGLNTWNLIKSGDRYGNLKPSEMQDILYLMKLEFHALNSVLVSLGDVECPLSFKDITCDLNTPFICTSCLINQSRH